jgi:hypothetical protein
LFGVDGLFGVVGTVPTPPPGVDDDGTAFSVTLTCPQPAAPSSASTETLKSFEHDLFRPVVMIALAPFQSCPDSLVAGCRCRSRQ